MAETQPISILFNSDNRLGIRLEVDTSFAGKLVESLDMVLTAGRVPDGTQISFAGDGWRVAVMMDDKVSGVVRDAIEHALISEIALPEMMRGTPVGISKRHSARTRRSLSAAWRKFVDYFFWR
ncbi:hypothetical protein JKG47_08380 [Acidithiobacillus sp. MC6.1]|nr:hypothetical protein [Acidithiobacillus sp. MC6.1]